jgi:hypothetical protein
MQSSSSLVCTVCAKLASCAPITASAPSRGATNAITAAAVDVCAPAPRCAARLEPPHADSTTALASAMGYKDPQRTTSVGEIDNPPI